MKTRNSLFAATVIVATLAAAGVAMAQPGMGPGMGGRTQGPETPAAAAARLGVLKAQLKVTAAQESAWQKYAAFVGQQRETSQAMRATMQAQRQAQMQAPRASAPIDRAAQREAMGQVRETHLAAHEAARQELYAVLTPEQKALAEHHLQGAQGRRMAGGMGGPAGGPMGGR